MCFNEILRSYASTAEVTTQTLDAFICALKLRQYSSNYKLIIFAIFRLGKVNC